MGKLTFGFKLSLTSAGLTAISNTISSPMPRKVRELEADLTSAGFERVEGKGSHRHYRHPLVAMKVTISGKGGSDAKPYQEKQVARAIANSKAQRP